MIDVRSVLDIISSKRNMATKDNWEDVIRTNYTDLLKMIDTDNGLHGEIRRLRIFSTIALKSFWVCCNISKNNNLTFGLIYLNI